MVANPAGGILRMWQSREHYFPEAIGTPVDKAIRAYESAAWQLGKLEIVWGVDPEDIEQRLKQRDMLTKAQVLEIKMWMAPITSIEK
eukprot:32206-Eustigmatos_ZCMA.PRE.1